MTRITRNLIRIQKKLKIQIRPRTNIIIEKRVKKLIIIQALVAMKILCNNIMIWKKGNYIQNCKN